MFADRDFVIPWQSHSKNPTIKLFILTGLCIKIQTSLIISAKSAIALSVCVIEKASCMLCWYQTCRIMWYLVFRHSWWRHQIETFTRYWPFVREFTGHRWIPPTKASDTELWCFLWSAPWINYWVNNREAADLRHHRAHYDVIAMLRMYRRWPVDSTHTKDW